MLKEFDDATKQCCWVEKGKRCENKPVSGSEKLSACTEHLELHRKMTIAPGEQVEDE